MARFPAPWNWIEPVVDGKTGRATATFLAWLSQQLAANKLIEGAVPDTREVNTTAPLTGGGNLSTDLTLGFDGGLDDLNDVDLTTPPTDGQALVYDSGDSEWKPGTVAAGLDVQQEGVTIEDPATVLNFTGTGVTVTTPSAGQVDIDISGGGTPVPFKGALVSNSTTQSIPNNTNTVLTWDTEVYDTDGFHSTSSNTSRLTIPAGVTRVRLTSMTVFDVNATGFRQAVFLKNGSPAFPGRGGTSSPGITGSGVYVLMVSPILEVTAGDYLEVRAYQNSGGALNVLGTDVSHCFAIEVIPEEYGGGSGGGSNWPPLQPPSAADFTSASGDATMASATDDADVGLLVDFGTPVSGDITRNLTTALPGGGVASWELTTRVILNGYTGNMRFNLHAYESGTGKHLNVGIQLNGSGIDFWRGNTLALYTSQIVLYSTQTVTAAYNPVWLRIGYDAGTDVYYFAYSYNGKQWNPVGGTLSIARTTAFTTRADRVGFSTQTGVTSSTRKNFLSCDYWSLT